MKVETQADQGVMALPMLLGVLVGFLMLVVLIQQSAYWSGQWFQHSHPTAIEVNAASSAYGICVRVWSTWSQADAMEERTVVSEIGEQ